MVLKFLPAVPVSAVQTVPNSDKIKKPARLPAMSDLLTTTTITPANYAY